METSFFWEGKKSNSVFSFIFERFQLLGRHFELLWFGEVAIFHEAGDQFKGKYIFQFQSFLVHSVNQHCHGKMDTIYFPGNHGVIFHGVCCFIGTPWTCKDRSQGKDL